MFRNRAEVSAFAANKQRYSQYQQSTFIPRQDRNYNIARGGHYLENKD